MTKQDEAATKASDRPDRKKSPDRELSDRELSDRELEDVAGGQRSSVVPDDWFLSHRGRSSRS